VGLIHKRGSSGPTSPHNKACVRLYVFAVGVVCV